MRKFGAQGEDGKNREDNLAVVGETQYEFSFLIIEMKLENLLA